MRVVVALLLIPQLVFAADLTPRLKEMSTRQLLEEYGGLEDHRPGLGAPIAVLGVSGGSLFLGLAISGIKFNVTNNTTGTTSVASGGPVGYVLIGLAVAGLLAGGAWLLFNLRRRVSIGEDLDAIQAELDTRETPAQGVTQPELLAMLAAPVARSTGGLVVVVSDAKGPVPAARVIAGGRTYACNDRGAATLDNLPPGPIALTITAPGHAKAEEAASVIAGKRTPVSLTLRADREEQSARLTGVVRSAETGEPIPAELTVSETNLRVPIDAQGLFRVDVPPGQYTVNIAASGYLSQTKQVKVKGGDRAIFNVDLHQR